MHSNVGNTCVGAKVNGKLVPLKTHLRNGDQVEIIRSKTSTPSPAWERFIVTAKARAEVRKFVRTQQRAQYLTLGRSILEKAFRQEGAALTEKLLETALDALNKKTIEDVYAEAGEGLITRQQVIEAVFPDKKTPEIKALTVKSPKKPAKQNGHAVPIRGLISGMAVHFAGCCHPLPEDRIVGIVTTGRGVTIHTIDCESLESFSDTPERWLEVAWDHDDQSAETFVGRIKVIVTHEFRQPRHTHQYSGKGFGQHHEPENHQPFRRLLRNHRGYRSARPAASVQHHFQPPRPRVRAGGGTVSSLTNVIVVVHTNRADQC